MPDELEYRLRQQELISDLGLYALKGADFESLCDETTRLVARGLDTRFAKMLQYLPEENRFLVIAGVGWREGVVGAARIGADLESPAGYALHTGRPVVSNHLAQEDRFRTPALLAEHGIQRAINVIIKRNEEPFGVLEVDSPNARKFTQHDIAFLQAAANILGTGIERRRIEHDLQELAAAKDMLLKELNHRVGNNLQVVSSLLSLEASRLRDSEARSRFTAVSARVQVLSRIHRQLHTSDGAATVRFGRYLEEFCTSLKEFYGLAAGPVTLRAEVEEMELSLDRAIPLALIVNELVTNSMKYAFPSGEGGEVRVALRRAEAGSVVLSVADNGVGGADEATGGGIGRELVRALTAQIDGVMDVASDGGTCVTVTFPG